MAGTIKGMTIEIGGNTAPLEQALKDTNKEINTTQKELNAVNKALKLDPTNTELLKQKQKLLGDQIGSTKTKLDALKQAQAQLDAEMKKGGNVNQEEYRKLEREIATTEGSLKKLKEEAKNTHPQLAKVEEALKKAGSVAGDIAKKGFELTVTGIQTMATACASAVTALGGLAVKAGAMADDLNTLASTSGLTTKQLQEFAYASDLIDVSTETLTGSLTKLTNNMNTAKKGSGDAYNAFKELGVEFKNSDGTLRNANDVFNDSIKALGKMENETERDALAMKLFGKSAKELNPLIEGGAEQLAEMSKQANDLGLILSQEALDGANAFNDQLDILKANGKATFQVIGTEIASQLTPAMEKINEVTMGYIKELTTALNEKGLEGLLEKAGSIIGDIASKIAKSLPEIAKIGTDVVISLVESIKDSAKDVGEAGVELISVLIEAFFEMMPSLIETAIQLATSFISSLGDKLPELIPVVVDGILKMIDAILNNIDLIIDAGVKLILGLTDGLINAIPLLVDKLPDIIKAIVDGLILLADRLLEVAKVLLTKLGYGLREYVGDLKESLVEIWEYIKQTLEDKFKGMVEIGKNMIERTMEWNQKRQTMAY